MVKLPAAAQSKIVRTAFKLGSNPRPILDYALITEINAYLLMRTFKINIEVLADGWLFTGTDQFPSEGKGADFPGWGELVRNQRLGLCHLLPLLSVPPPKIRPVCPTSYQLRCWLHAWCTVVPFGLIEHFLSWYRVLNCCLLNRRLEAQRRKERSEAHLYMNVEVC